jgi:hypothetical protein
MKKLLIFLFLFASLNCAKAEYFVFIGDRIVPVFEDVKVGNIYGGNTPIMVFAKGGGQKIDIYWDGKKESTFDGSGAIILRRKKGTLEIKGQINKLMYVIVLEGTTESAKVIDKHFLLYKDKVYYKKILE